MLALVVGLTLLTPAPAAPAPAAPIEPAPENVGGVYTGELTAPEAAAPVAAGSTAPTEYPNWLLPASIAAVAVLVVSAGTWRLVAVGRRRASIRRLSERP